MIWMIGFITYTLAAGVQPILPSLPAMHYACPQHVVAAMDAGVLHSQVRPFVRELSSIAVIDWPEDFDQTEHLVLVEKSRAVRELQRRAGRIMRSSEDTRFRRSLLLVQAAAYLIQADFVRQLPDPPYVPADGLKRWHTHLKDIQSALLMQTQQSFSSMAVLPGRWRDAGLQQIAEQCAADLNTKKGG